MAPGLSVEVCIQDKIAEEIESKDAVGGGERMSINSVTAHANRSAG